MKKFFAFLMTATMLFSAIAQAETSESGALPTEELMELAGLEIWQTDLGGQHGYVWKGIAINVSEEGYQYSYEALSGVCIRGYEGGKLVLTIPDRLDGQNVTRIAENAFQDTTADSEDELDAGSNAVIAQDNLTEVHLPETLLYIDAGAFAFQDELTEIVIPDSVLNIGFCAFENCKGLKSIQLSSSLREISAGICADCISLEKVNIPDGVTSIGSQAFARCSELIEISIPDSVTEIADDAFADDQGLTIVASENSFAKQFAEEHEIPFRIAE